MYRERLQITNVKLLPQECLIGSCLGAPGEKMNAVSDSLDTPNDKARNGLLEINPRSRAYFCCFFEKNVRSLTAHDSGKHKMDHWILVLVQKRQ